MKCFLKKDFKKTNNKARKIITNICNQMDAIKRSKLRGR